MKNSMYLLRIQLQYLEPHIWRLFAVPSAITLDRLHDVIQIVMGWKDCHLHAFRFKDRSFVENVTDFEKAEAGAGVRLGDLAGAKGKELSYVYDFGDSWDHEITVVTDDFRLPEFADGPAGRRSFFIECVDGARACPPEDVGSVPGYMEFCKAMKSKRGESYAMYKEWYETHPLYSGKFDSEHFDIDEVNLALRMYMRHSRDRSLPWGIEF